ncbi:hypothetical protein J6590_061833 [Homalodisca vitripennis]|nr:hypothetical protein J6590_061833 [Homalodisca vitripennis]
MNRDEKIANDRCRRFAGGSSSGFSAAYRRICCVHITLPDPFSVYTPGGADRDVHQLHLEDFLARSFSV